MIQRIDHLVAVVQDFEAARRLWLEAGCPLVYDGRSREHASACFSIGRVNLEILSREALVGWPALARWRAWTDREFGLHAVAFDPGDLDTTVAELRAKGLDATEPRDGMLTPSAGMAVAGRWRNSYVDALTGLLPGLPSFLCEFLAPEPRIGRCAPESPIRFVELQLGVPDPIATAPAYERILGVRSVQDGEDLLLPLADTPIRLTKASGISALLTAASGAVARTALSDAIPGLTLFGPNQVAEAFAGRLTHLFPDPEETRRFLTKERASWADRSQ